MVDPDAQQPVGPHLLELQPGLQRELAECVDAQQDDLVATFAQQAANSEEGVEIPRRTQGCEDDPQESLVRRCTMNVRRVLGFFTSGWM